MVEAGSDVTFRWTIDDKPSLTFHNTVFNVIYQSAAIFKLSVGRGQWRVAWGPGISGCSLCLLFCFALPLRTLLQLWVSVGRLLSRGSRPFTHWSVLAASGPYPLMPVSSADSL